MKDFLAPLEASSPAERTYSLSENESLRIFTFFFGGGTFWSLDLLDMDSDPET